MLNLPHFLLASFGATLSSAASYLARSGAQYPEMAQDQAQLAGMTIAELAPLLERRKVSPVEVLDASLGRIAALDHTLRAFITLTPERASDQARAAEREIMAGRYRGALHGIPIGHKDVFWTKGVRTTAHSRVLWEFVPDSDAPIVERLQIAGAVSLGKLNTYEFATGATPIVGASTNPWSPTHSSGGSSGGSASAVAAGLCYGATGSDTGGSIRSPASFCGVVGVKPTYGRVSRRGMIPLSWSLDHAGVIARSALDAAVLLNAIAGPDSQDPGSNRAPAPDYVAGTTAAMRDLGSLRIGVLGELGPAGVRDDVASVFENTMRVVTRLVASVRQIDLPAESIVQAAYYGIRVPEATLCHSGWLRSSALAYAPFTRRKLLLGACVDPETYLEAQQLRAGIRAEIRTLFADVDLLIWPTTRRTSFLVEEPEEPCGVGSELMNLTGYPAVSIPCGSTIGGLPVGLQITARPDQECVAFALAQAIGYGTTLPSVAPTTDPQPERVFATPAMPSGTSRRDEARARRQVDRALRNAGFPAEESDRAHLAVALCAHRAAAARAKSLTVGSGEPAVHQLPD